MIVDENMRVSMRTRVQTKNELGFGNDNVQLGFVPDIEDGRNKEWAAATPTLSFSMTVIPAIAEKFEVGEKITFYAEKTKAEEENNDERQPTDQ
jgi:hypothetical protein